MKHKYLIKYHKSFVSKEQIVKAKSKTKAIECFNKNNNTCDMIITSIKKMPLFTVDLLIYIINVILALILFLLISYAVINYDENKVEIESSTIIDNFGEPVKLSNSNYETGDVSTLTYNIPQ